MARADSILRSMASVTAQSLFLTAMLAQSPARGADVYAKGPTRGELACETASPGPVENRDCDDNGIVPITERERQRNFSSIPAIRWRTDSETSSGRPVSVSELENPLSKEGKKLLDTAQADLKAGKTTEALAALRKATEDPSTAAYAHGILGSAYVKAGQLDIAIYELREASRLMPGYQVFHSNLAAAHLLNQQPQEAEREARRALRLEWNSPQAHYILGMALITQGIRLEEALDHLRTASETMPAVRDALMRAASIAGRQ
jgi:tetratricopeptide (TPR) repeat protein